jgi:hypothetical protein
MFFSILLPGTRKAEAIFCLSNIKDRFSFFLHTVDLHARSPRCYDVFTINLEEEAELETRRRYDVSSMVFDMPKAIHSVPKMQQSITFFSFSLSFLFVAFLAFV